MVLRERAFFSSMTAWSGRSGRGAAAGEGGRFPGRFATGRPPPRAEDRGGGRRGPGQGAGDGGGGAGKADGPGPPLARLEGGGGRPAGGVGDADGGEGQDR